MFWMGKFCPFENYSKDFLLLFCRLNSLFMQKVIINYPLWSSLNKNLIGRFLRFLSNFKNWIFYSFEHNFWSSQPEFINDPSKFKFIFPLSNAKELIIWKFIELEKITSKSATSFSDTRYYDFGLFNTRFSY